MIKINLIAEGKRPTSVRKIKPVLEGKDLAQWALVASIIACLLAFGVWWWLLHRQIAIQEVKIEEAERKVEELAPVIRQVEDFKKKKAEIERKLGVIEDLKRAQQGPVHVMDDISRALPELLWLDRLKMTSSNIELEGRAFNTNAVANFIENLDKMPAFEEPTLRSTEEQPGGVYHFILDFNYSFAQKAPAEPPPAAGALPSPTQTPPAPATGPAS
ncbi:MAG TPA: PilN domain-containing protein [Thermoanaerobaculia bacterium]|jgi:type IV pilus assembly protein PilN|nr:PilN domain-containing protein [Thermoanaerobaculia bacterium]